MKTEKMVRILMKGNAFEFEFNKEYDLDMVRATELIGLGYAVLAETVPGKKEELNGI